MEEGAPNGGTPTGNMGIGALSIQQHHSRSDSRHCSPRSACIETLSPRDPAFRAAEVLRNYPGLLWFAVTGACAWNGGLLVVVCALLEAVVGFDEAMPLLLTLLGLVFLSVCVVGGVRMLQFLSKSFPSFLLEALFGLVVLGMVVLKMLLGNVASGVLVALYYCGVIGLVLWMDARNPKSRVDFDSFH